MVNLTALHDIEPLALNTSVVTQNDTINDTASIFITNAPYWLMPVTLILFVTLTYFIYKKINWNLDIVQASVVAAFINIMVSYAFLRMSWTVSAVPLGFWGMIWLILIISMFYIKKR